ncbi:MAG: AMP-binding protein [Burkholderiaceae bacterium]|nr:AMP-binding protein [Burkholderiaceae bacterium]
MNGAGDVDLYSLLASGFPDDLSDCCIETEDGSRYSWSDVERASAMLANLLVRLDLSAGDRVAVQVEKSPEALLLYLATLRAGLVFLPLNSAYRAAEIDYFVGDAEPAVVVCSPANLGWVGPIARRHRVRHVFTLGADRSGTLLEAAAAESPEFETRAVRGSDLACIVYTSGTTGRSKGAMLSHANICSNALVLHRYWRWRRGDVLIHALPIFHVHGLFVACHGALLSGSPMLWLARFDVSAVIERLPRATVFMGVPTMYVRLLDDERFDVQATRGMRLFVSGSAPLLPDTFRRFEERTGRRILERYGMSETAMLTSNPYDGERVAGTVGLPLPGVELRVVGEKGVECRVGDVGAIQVRGPNVFSGYWRMPEKTREEFTEDGFFRTGDLGELREDGMLRLTGRAKELFKTAKGKYVAPAPIENRLNAHPMVELSLVSGIGQPAAYAIVQLAEDLRPRIGDATVRAQVQAELERLLDEVNRDVADYEQLRMIVVTREPWAIENGYLTPTMKVRRSRIEAAVEAHVERWYAGGQKVQWA